MPAQAASARADTIWYISTRARENGRVLRRLADSLEFGYVVSSVKSDGDVIVNALGLTFRDSVRLSRSAFIESLRERSGGTSTADPVAILYVHGFGTWQHELFSHATQSSIRSRSPIPWVVFSWPSRGSGITWPRAGEVFARAYWEDSASAMASGPALAEGLHAVLDAVGGAHVLLVAHSLGAQVTSATLAGNDSLRQRLAADPLRAFAFFAPDVDAKRFRDTVVPAMLPLTHRLLLYASEHDRILQMSKALNKGDRAGLIRGSPPLPIRLAGLETIDVTDGLASGGWMQRVFGSHHGLNRASAALFDLTQLVARKFPAACRATLGTASLLIGGEWRLTSMSPPDPVALDACR
ncbi:MAG: alpha/beta hydrolase [Gemmatimonas sp.]